MSEERFYYYIYLDPRKNFEPFYAGKGTGYRVARHLKQTQNSFCQNVIKAIRKAGLEPTICVSKLITEAESFAWETQIIKRYGRRDLGTGCLTNLTDGGEGQSGWVPSEETRAKIGHSNRGRTHTEEAKAKISCAQIGNQKAKGYKHTDEAREKIKAKRAKQVFTPESNAKRSASLKAYTKTPEHLANLTKACNSIEYRKKHSVLAKKRNSIKVECPHCGKQGQNRVMKRWHFDNCKQRKD